jgi:hypothetical protein
MGREAEGKESCGATGNQGRYEYSQYSAPTHDSSGLYRKHTSAHACVPELHLCKLCLRATDSYHTIVASIRYTHAPSNYYGVVKFNRGLKNLPDNYFRYEAAVGAKLKINLSRTPPPHHSAMMALAIFSLCY